jgi:hypothetical protein
MTARVNANPSRRRQTPASVDEPAPFEPLRLKKRAPVEEEPRVVLFEVDGEPYTMLAVVDAGRALILEVMLLGVETERRKALILLQQLCGMDAYRALVSDADFTIEQLLTLGQILSDHAFGPLEEGERSGN